jgi:cytoskeletal protein CcmA (bactofilin family)
MAFEVFDATKVTTTTATSSAAQLLSVLGASAKLEGKFEISDSIHVECEVGGEMSVGGKLVIGQSGTVHADVHTVDAVIMGQYEGNLVATGDVEITATGRVTGNIETDSLVIAKGGFFNGNVVKIREASGAGTGPRPLYSLDERRQAVSR